MNNMGVWWDMDTCLLPPDLDRYQVRQRIESALENHLPFTISAIPSFTISAIGDLRRIPEADLEAILSTGFFTKHVIDGPVGILQDMRWWAQNHPPPSTLILISDHEDKFVENGFFHSLKAAKYTIIRAYAKVPVVSPDYAYSTLAWDYLLSAPNQEIKSWIETEDSETAWFCDRCIHSTHLRSTPTFATLAGESFESLITHLKSEEHKFLEGEEEDSVSLPMKKTGVWWDIDTCLPQEYDDPHQVRRSIESAFKDFLPMTISAIGNLKRIPYAFVEPILSTGISMKHSINGTSSIMEGMVTWAQNNPPPATLILISDREEDFVECGVFRWFKHRGYTIVRAFQKHPKVSPFYATQTILWDYLLPAWYEVTNQEVDEATNHEVEDKCSATAWHCDLCISSGQPFAGETLESLTRHFKTIHHLYQEVKIKYFEAQLKLKYCGAEEASTQSKKTGVWWDINTCPVPRAFDLLKVRQKLESAFSHFLPTTTVHAFGNLERTLPGVLETIFSTPIIPTHVKEGEKMSIFLDMKRWTDENPPPATLVLISDREGDFVESGLLPLFVERGYTIIRAFQKHPEVPPTYASRTILWDYLLPGVFSSQSGAKHSKKKKRSMLRKHSKSSGNTSNPKVDKQSKASGSTSNLNPSMTT